MQAYVTVSEKSHISLQKRIIKLKELGEIMHATVYRKNAQVLIKQLFREVSF